MEQAVKATFCADYHPWITPSWKGDQKDFSCLPFFLLFIRPLFGVGQIVPPVGLIMVGLCDNAFLSPDPEIQPTDHRVTCWRCPTGHNNNQTTWYEELKKIHSVTVKKKLYNAQVSIGVWPTLFFLMNETQHSLCAKWPYFTDNFNAANQHTLQINNEPLNINPESLSDWLRGNSGKQHCK